MKRHKLNIVFVFFFAVILTFSANAQIRPHSQRWSKIYHTPKAYRDWMFNLSVGDALYYGGLSSYDLDPAQKIPNESNLAYSVSAGKWVNPYLAMRVNFYKGSLHSLKNTHDMNSDFNEYTAQILVNVTDFFNYQSGYQRKFYSYVFLGYGLIDFRSTVYNTTTGILEKEWGTDKMITEWVIPAGVGLAYNFNQNFTFAFDATYHYINTDKLDAYSNDSKDFMLYLALNVTYNFNLKQINGYITRPKSRRSLKWAKF